MMKCIKRLVSASVLSHVLLFPQMDEIMSLLKQMAPREAKVTIHRLSTWATVFLSDKEHISKEVRKGFFLWCTCTVHQQQQLHDFQSANVKEVVGEFLHFRH